MKPFIFDPTFILIIPAKKVLDAAALTYVAAAVMAVFQLIRLIMISGLLGRNDD